MRLERTRLRMAVIKGAFSAIFAIQRRDRDVGRLLRKGFQIARSEGINGVKSRLLVLARLNNPYLPMPERPTYTKWVEQFDALRESNSEAARSHLSTLDLPEVLIVLMIGPDHIALLPRVVASWSLSLHSRWQAAILAPAELPENDLVAIRSLADGVVGLSVLRTSHELRAMIQRFDYSLICRGPILLNSFSLYMFLEAALRTGADIVYADNDIIDSQGSRASPNFKPQFSPEYLRRFNYVGDCLLVSKSTALGGAFDTSLVGGAAMFDRFVSGLVPGKIVEHVPFTLSHSLDDPRRSMHDIAPVDEAELGVAIIIPTRDGLAYLKPCIESILSKSSYRLDLIEIILIDNGSSDPKTLRYLDRIGENDNVRVLRYPFPFSFPDLNNFGAKNTAREVLVFLNNDTVVFDPEWLRKLVHHARQPDVGVVGAKLLFPDGKVQHGGCVAGSNMGAVQHLHLQANPADIEADDHTREMSLVTGACCAIRREVFEKVGGFDPVLKITWNDVKLCLDCLSAGYRNVYVADPLFYHDESKTRGRDDNREKMLRYFGEANYTLRQYSSYFHDDPSYNPNLSFETVGQLAEPPRIRRPWSREAGHLRRILVLSSVYRFGFGVPLVIQQQVSKLVRLGYEVVIGGPKGDNEADFPGCKRVFIGSVKEAAVYAFDSDVSLIISHTPPFFEISNIIGPHIPVLAYDYGEPSPYFFDEPVRSYLLNVEFQKRSAAALTTTISTISQAVKDETLNSDAVVVGLANSHLPSWSPDCWPQREAVREELGWQNRFVVLTVCRFGKNERGYKGLDKIAAILREFPYLHPRESRSVVWVLAGAGSAEDVKQAEALGFVVFPNVSDQRLVEIYKAADAYMGFSRWEGYNLGISQALAMGLPIMASDIPAHREFPIATSNSILVACHWLASEIDVHSADDQDRVTVVYEWEARTTRFSQLVEQTIETTRVCPPRLGASARYARDGIERARRAST